MLNGNAIQGIQADGAEASTVSIPLNVSTNVTTSVQDWISGVDLSNFGWALIPSGPSGFEFVSSEGLAGKPTLTIEVDVTATVTIKDDDSARVTITKVSDAAEDTVVGKFAVTLLNGVTPVSSSQNTVVSYEIQVPTSGSNPQAQLGSDYAHKDSGLVGFPSTAPTGTVTIPAGATQAFIEITPFPDKLLGRE